MSPKIKLIKSDITKVKAEAIVNAANETLLGGLGVDGAIHQAAGPKLLEECTALGGCRVGEAKITKGYKLPAKYVIHTVGPVWMTEPGKDSEKLAACYRHSLELAIKHKIKTIAFPSISTGYFGYPIAEAAPVAIRTVKKFLADHDEIEQVIFVVFSEEDYNIYQDLCK